MIIALLTDFGVDDIYDGVMKGVMSRICTGARFIDITHSIEPQNVRQAAFALMSAFRYFPAQTVFLVVVDPGVGSTRRPIAVQAGDYFFVAPDNGVLSYAMHLLKPKRVEAVEIAMKPDAEISNTFHGRDVFAPAAATLASGMGLAQLGRPIEKLMTLPFPELVYSGRELIGEVTHIDRFGNLVTSIGHMRWSDQDKLRLSPVFGDHTEPIPVSALNATAKVGGGTITGVRRTYAEAERGHLLSLVGSTSFLEVSMNQGSAAERLDVEIGDRVVLHVGDIDAAVRD